MFKFLRFEIGGVSTFIWIVIFSSPYISVPKIFALDTGDLVAGAVGAIAIFLPLGNYIHQIVDSIANPFLKKRAHLFPRRSLEFIESRLAEKNANFHDKTYQSLIVFSEAIEQSWKVSQPEADASSPRLDEFTIDAQTVRENITNRYSYYYARIESGLFAPLFGFLISILVLSPLQKINLFLSEPQFNEWYTYIAAVVVAAGMLWRIPQLFKELDDLEIMLVATQENIWIKMLPPSISSD